eukprot:TRINITY_DN48423_c0_g1_i1.p1 TRINITY_DN48423_c0_g1~~TRINITY_DN48423_c0_g1_i1.p1  ORF type:complete len:992 (+),score=85.68 TRINITY_DN48423_c0_g1_i1:407-2977(+)
MDAVETGRIPDIDIIIGLSDVPYCELYPWGRNAPVMVFAQRKDCGNILIPDNSLMHNEYRHGDHNSAFHYLRLVRDSRKTPWDTRQRGIVWDGEFNKPSRRNLASLSEFLSVEPSLPLSRFDVPGTVVAHRACNYTATLDAEGFSYSMRLKNILLCGSGAIRYLPPPYARYEEYWVPAMIEFKHYLSVRAETAAASRKDLMHILALPDDVIHRVAQEGFRFAVNVLRPEMVLEYLISVLTHYSSLQDFDVAAAHSKDASGFTQVTRGDLALVRQYAYRQQVHVFNFYFPDLSTDRLSTRRFLDIHDVPCWGTVHRFLQCCSNRFYFYSENEGLKDDGLRHPFCRSARLSLKASEEHSADCCNRVVNEVVPLFENSIGKYPHDELMIALDRTLQSLPIELGDVLRLLDLACNMTAFQASLMSASGALKAADAQVSLSWVYHEARLLTTMLLRASRDLDLEPAALEPLRKLYAERIRIRSTPQRRHAATEPVVDTRPDHDPATQSDVLLVLGTEENVVSLKSLLANRRCALRLHLLYPDDVVRPWAETVIEARGDPDLWFQRYWPREAADEMCRYVPQISSGPLSGQKCDITYARLVPELWLLNVTLLVTLDFSDPDVGPLILGDVCALPALTLTSPGETQAVAAAAMFEEHARWSLQLWSPSVMLMDLRVKRRFTPDAWFEGLADAYKTEMEAGAFGYRGSPSRIYTQFWLTFMGRGRSSFLLSLPNTWNFVPYEPWLVDLPWDDMLQIPSFLEAWRGVFLMREYPGFDGHTVRVACPPSTAFLPTAVWTLDELYLDARIADRIPDQWEKWKGPDTCHEPVHVMALRWERSHMKPRYPYELRRAPWLRELIALYRRL